ncbi:MAG: DUF2237 domain-containing protein [Bacteriovoracaceae bacterium]|nr:DUF2237 domain-containing protein [Bacteriovoracaceae bacterium]
MKNVLGGPLKICSCEPMTGFFRDGYCRTDIADNGVHTVCAVMTDEFLAYSKSMGNDLSTPREEFGFLGLKEGDHWCLCAGRWLEAYRAHKAPRVILEACDEETLAIIPIEALKECAHS